VIPFFPSDKNLCCICLDLFSWHRNRWEKIKAYHEVPKDVVSQVFGERIIGSQVKIIEAFSVESQRD